MIKSGNRKKSNNNSGLTLVELLIVLIVLGLLASAAVYGVIGYINKTRFDKNNANAVSIYQSAESALTHMSENGTLDEWVKNLVADSNALDPYNTANPVKDPNDQTKIKDAELYDQADINTFTAFPNSPDTQRGLSRHMRYALTYTPGSNDSQSNILYALLQSDFNSTDLFSGIITVEFDVEKKLDSDGRLHYSANVISVFYDSKRSSWDDAALNGVAAVAGYSFRAPFRDEDYRRNTSYVGYFYADLGTTAVDSVFLPLDTDIKDVLFTLRNGETLDMTWSAVSTEGAITGKPSHIHYTFTLYDKASNNPLCNLVVNENSIANGKYISGVWEPDGQPQEALNTESFYDKLKFDKTTFSNGSTRVVDYHGDNYTVVYTKVNVTDENHAPLTIYRASITTTAKVYLHRINQNNPLNDHFNYNKETADKLQSGDNYYSFPLTVSYEIYDLYGNTYSERISYSLSLDAMMSRNVLYANFQNNTLIRSQDYCVSRLFNTGKLSETITPRNIYATMTILPDNFQYLSDTYNHKDTEGTLPASETYYAERALDDPAYLLDDGEIKTYRYANNGLADFGTGRAVVNTFFGDIDHGSIGSNGLVDGGNVVITSFRHLYNMRFVSGFGKSITYSIKRDLNWYTIHQDPTKPDDPLSPKNTYSSDVIVYTAVNNSAVLKGNSPVPVPTDGVHTYGQVLNVVSFPSIPKLNTKATLIACPSDISTNAADPTSVINNVQMRMASFYWRNTSTGDEIETKLKGYGLIAESYGTVINIRANGMTLTLSNVPDGSSDDRAAIKGLFSQILTPGSNVNTFFLPDSDTFDTSSPLGGLIGANRGIVGDSTKPNDKNNNTIRFSNCIVTSAFYNGTKWQVYEVSAVGGIIGDNNGKTGQDSSVFGYLEATGNFGTAGMIDVSSIIGYTKTSIDALIYVDNTNTKYNDKPIITFDPVGGKAVHSVIYATSDCVGSAIGSAGATNFNSNNMFLCHLKQVSNTINPSVSSGVVTPVPESNIFAIDVKLDDCSFILMKTDEAPKSEKRPTSIGGAIGRIAYCKQSDYVATDCNEFSIRVVNDGYIISSEGTTHDKHVGGAVGVILGCSFSEMEISVENNGTIGSYSAVNNSSVSHTTGGAVGLISNMVTSGSKIDISVINKGEVNGNCSNLTGTAKGGIGGAVGAFTGSLSHLPVFRICSINDGIIKGSTPATDDFRNAGVGGAVGFIEYMPANSAFYCNNYAGKTISTTGRNAGGCIGSLYFTYSNNSTLTTASNTSSSGTTVRADLKSGSKITSDGDNAGGAIGYYGRVFAGVNVKAVIDGEVSINASSNAGGVCGGLLSQTDSDTTVINLIGTGSTTINIKAEEDNAGGLIGFVDDAPGGFGLKLNLPTQEAGDEMIFKIDCKNNAGGMIGQFRSQTAGKDVTSDFSVIFNSHSYVHAENSCAGGSIGLIDSKATFKSKVSVCDPSGDDSTKPYVLAGETNVGGCIGSIINFTQHEDSVIEYESSRLLIKCEKTDDTGTTLGSNVGGCIGSVTGSSTLGGHVLMKGPDASANPVSIELTGKENVGGCIGFCGSSASITKEVTASVTLQISGENSIGGCIGKIDGGKIGKNGKVTFSSSDAVITCTCVDTSKYILCRTGGVVGYFANGSLEANSALIFNGTNCKITGKDNTGGVIGRIESTTADATSNYTFNGTETEIKGEISTGGIIGASVLSSNKGIITMNPVTKCTIEGTNNVGGVVGLGSKNYNNSTNDSGKANLPNKDHLTLSLNSCEMIVTGSGCTGGIVGVSENGCWYSGGSITVKGGGKLNITSTGSVSGGNVGYLTDSVNLGGSSILNISCEGGSAITISGKNAAGGFIGEAANDKAGKNNNNFSMSLTVGSDSSFAVTSVNGAAGGIAGINRSELGRNDVNIELPKGGGSMTITGTYAGALVGQNLGTFRGNGYNKCKYTIHATINDHSPASFDNGLDLLFGQRGNLSNFSYKANDMSNFVNCNVTTPSAATHVTN